jgi:predicted aminopeptidase
MTVPISGTAPARVASAVRSERRGRRWLRRTLWTLVLAPVVVLAVLVVLPIGRYLLRAAWEEAKILARRRPILAFMGDSTVPADVRQRLALVLEARRFAVDSIGLDAEESFTTFSPLERDTLVLVLSAAPRDRLESYTWWFPIVGSVPYKGFFDFGAALGAQRDLERRGFDTYMRPASAFSTLGWFNDPLLSSTLRLPEGDLASTVIHELTHNTRFVKGEVEFNESFASFVGARGAAWFFRTRGQPELAKRVEREWADDKLIGSFWAMVVRGVDSAYAAHPTDSAARVAARDTVFTGAKRVLVEDLAPQLQTIPKEFLVRVRLDNASLLARRVYASDLFLFDEVYRRRGSDLRQTVRLIDALVRDGGEPFEALRKWLATA